MERVFENIFPRFFYPFICHDNQSNRQVSTKELFDRECLNRYNFYINWAAPSEFGAYRLCEQRRFRRACACAQSRQPPLLAHTSSESRGTFRRKARSLAPLNGWACAVKICHDGMLEDTNSLDSAQFLNNIRYVNNDNHKMQQHFSEAV